MTTPLTPRQWAEKAFDGIEADESLFASVERVIGEAMAMPAAKGRVAKLESVYTFGAGMPIPEGYVFAGISDDGRPFYESRSDRIKQLEAALRSIAEKCKEASGSVVSQFEF
jgi:hypothetical protein